MRKTSALPYAERSSLAWRGLARLTCAAALAVSCSPAGDAEPTSSSLHDAPATELPLSYASITVRNDGGVARFEGAQLAGKPGQPMLPVQTVRVLLSPDADLGRVSVAIEDAEVKDVPGTFQVQPALPMASKGVLKWPAGANIVNGKDMDVYGKNELFPASNVGTVTPGRLHRYKLVEVLVMPYRWNPVTGALRALVSGRLVVRAAPEAAGADASNKTKGAPGTLEGRHAAQLASLVANFDTAIGQYEAASTGGGLEQRQSALIAPGANGYAIITTDGVRTGSDQLGKFADAKAAQGFAVELITQTGAYKRQAGWVCQQQATPCTGGWGGGLGDAAANGIRTWLKSNYVGHKLAYVLLIGNPDPVGGDVPMKITWPFRGDFGGDGDPIPTDFYYGELSGTWDYDNDGFVGEMVHDLPNGDPDLYAEVHVGRIPFYGEMAQLDHILAKTIAYGDAAPGSTAWRKNALLPMKPLDAYPTPTYQLGEWIRSAYLIPNGWSATRVYDQSFGVAPEAVPCTYDNVVSLWRSTPRGLVLWTTHGNPLGTSEVIDVERTHQLDDLHPSIVFGLSCSAAYPETPGNLTYSLLRNGAVAAVGAARDATYTPFTLNLSGTSGGEAYVSSFAKFVVTANQSVGEALSSIRTEVNQDWFNGLIFTLYGDPSVAIGNTGTGAIVTTPAPVASAERGESFVKISWSSVPAAAGFVVRRATTPGGPWTPVGTTSSSVTSYTDRDVNNDTTYYYVVSGFNTSGDGTPSAEVAATPGSRIKVQYQVGDSASTDNVIRPNLRIVNSGTIAEPLSRIGVRYYFTDENPGDWSFTCVSATIGCDKVMSWTGFTSAAGANSFVMLYFSDTATLAPGQSIEVQGYISHAEPLSYNESDDFSYDATRTTFADFRRTPAYLDGMLEWGYEPQLFWTIHAPDFLTVIPGNRQVSLSWASVNEATSYKVYRASDGAPRALIAQTQNTYWLDTNLANDTQYTYQVVSINPGGESAVPSSANATPSGSTPSAPPPAPTGLTATVEGGVASISWDSAATATHYNLKRATSSGGPYLDVRPHNLLTSATVIGLTTGVTYYFVVSATNYAGEGPNSEELALTTNGVLPARVTGLQATAGNAQVSLRWNAAARATGYVVKRLVSGGYQNVGTTPGTTTFTDSNGSTGLINGTTYTYVVAATNAAGEGASSASVSATPKAPTEPCSPAQDMSNGNSGNFGTTGAVCKRTSDNIAGWGCANFAGRTVKVNGVSVECGKTPLPPKLANGYYYFEVSAGAFPYASFWWWR